MGRLLQSFPIGLAAGLFLVLGASSADNTNEAEVNLKVVKYVELCKAIEELKGKVVVVDYWADT